MSNPRTNQNPRPWIRLVFMAVVGMLVALVVWQAATLPDKVPSHIGFDGEIDGWDTKRRHLMFTAIVGLLIAGFTGPWTPLVERRMSNIPNREYWGRTDNWPFAKEMLREDIAVLGIMTMLLFGWYTFYLGSLATAGDPSFALILVPVLLYLLGVIVYVVWMRRSDRYDIPTTRQTHSATAGGMDPQVPRQPRKRRRPRKSERR